MNSLPVSWQTVLLLAGSNIFMTFAWYGHLKNLADRPWWTAALVSWGIALFEYLLQVPANRIGHAGGMTLAQLKITQEVREFAAAKGLSDAEALQAGMDEKSQEFAARGREFYVPIQPV